MAEQRYFIEIAFDGTNYHGWQIQPNAITVQEVINKALSTLLRQPIETTGCGRTDTGVHATQLFAHMDVSIANSPLPIGKEVDESIDHSPTSIGKDNSAMIHGPSTINPSTVHDPSTIGQNIVTINHNKCLGSLNALLPSDIAVKRIIPVHSEAHARFDATLRSYEYHIHFHKDPFKINRSWLVRDAPDVELMNQAAGILMEYTDFSCFSRSNTQVKTNNCKISRAEWVWSGEDSLVFHISADRFLRNMVRAIVGTLMMVGRKVIKPEEVRAIIDSKNRSNAGNSVPACGLYLTEVRYSYL